MIYAQLRPTPNQIAIIDIPIFHTELFLDGKIKLERRKKNHEIKWKN